MLARRWMFLVCCGVLGFANSPATLADDADPLSPLMPLPTVTIMVDAGLPAAIATLAEGVAMPTGVKAGFTGLPKGVILRQGVLKADQGSVFAPLLATPQAVPGTYNATLLLTRGKDRREAEVTIVIEPFDTYGAISKSIRLEIPKGQPPVIPRGKGFAYSADVYNMAARPIAIPPNRSPTTNSSTRPVPPFPLGTIQRWMEPLDGQAIPGSPPRRGGRYAAGGDDYAKASPLQVGRFDRTSIQEGWLVLLAPGRYRLTFEFIPADPNIEFDSLMEKGKPAASASIVFTIQ